MERVTTIQLPQRATLSNIEALLSNSSFFVLPHPRRYLIVFPNEDVFFEPIALALLAAWAEYQVAKGNSISCKNAEGDGAAYAWRMKLFDFLHAPYETTRRVHDAGDRFLPLTEIWTNEQLTSFVGSLGEVLHLADVEHRNTVKYCFSELIRNVLEHAGNVSAFACAQYYEASNRVSVGVADSGRGVRSSFGARYPTADDQEALVLALTPGISGATGTRENAGAGLFFIKSIARYSRGSFVFASGKACYHLQKAEATSPILLHYDPLQEPHALTQIPTFSGTIVGVDIHVKHLTSYDKLMSAIREAYIKDRQGTEKIIKKVKFT